MQLWPLGQEELLEGEHGSPRQCSDLRALKTAAAAVSGVTELDTTEGTRPCTEQQGVGLLQRNWVWAGSSPAVRVPAGRGPPQGRHARGRFT